MKKLLIFTLLTMAVPLGALASTVHITGSGGTLWIDANGLATSSSSGFTSPSQLSRVQNLGGSSFNGANLGSLTFSTGALTSGSLGSNSTFAGGGGFTLALNGSVKGLPNTVLFQGAFSSPVTVAQMNNGTFTLTGNINGLLGGHTVGGSATILTGPMRNGQLSINTVNVDIALPVPEPGTLTLLGTGLLGMAGLARRNWRGSKRSRS